MDARENFLSPFLDRIRQCGSAFPHDARVPFFDETHQIGWVDARLFPYLDRLGYRRDTGYVLPKSATLASLGETLVRMRAFEAFGELFDIVVHDTFIGQIDRGALPLLGLPARGVHLNGIVHHRDGTYLWIARRAKTKRLDPGKLDQIVAGGVCAGLSPEQALAKEAAEEAAISPEMIRQATYATTLRYDVVRPEGLRCDTLYCYDIVLPESFQPRPVDGEVAHFACVPLSDVFAWVRDTQDVKFNVNLVLIDLFIRHGYFNKHDTEVLRNALNTLKSEFPASSSMWVDGVIVDKRRD